MDDVNGRRRYSSRLRAQQAQQTRHAVLKAAEDLFVANGYGSTTVEQVAERAGVSKPSVFRAVGNKQALLRTVRDVALAGDDDATAVRDRPGPQAVRTAPDLHRAARLLARHLREVAERYADLYEVIRGAAALGESDLVELWNVEEDQRLIGAAHWVDTLSSKTPLHQGSSRQSVIDEVWLLMAPDNYSRLVGQRGWTHARYENWLSRRLTTLWQLPHDARGSGGTS
ncbi:TetR/AcrR family transcriptional regulator [Kribbella sp. NPDC051586]|uniref:TetR/AcrR family transcriptional regulator n=1 Tax=Kribbella sp. NPDC051586 TaxID=3364118 RepID=UPI00379EF3AF